MGNPARSIFEMAGGNSIRVLGKFHTEQAQGLSDDFDIICMNINNAALFFPRAKLTFMR
jgi:hypothetical protein